MAAPDDALVKAILAGDAAAADRALGQGADPNGQTNQRAPSGPGQWDLAPVLTLAAVLGRTEIAGALLNAGAKVEVRSTDFRPSMYHDDDREEPGPTELGYAAWAGQFDVVRLLCQHGARANNAEVFDVAAGSGNVELIRWLVAQGNALNDVPRGMRRPLEAAISSGRPEGVLALLDLGATLDARANDGMTPLLMAAQRGAALVVEALLDRGEKADARSALGRNAMAHAIAAGSRETVRLLVQRGVPFEPKAIIDTAIADLAQTASFNPGFSPALNFVRTQRGRLGDGPCTALAWPRFSAAWKALGANDDGDATYLKLERAWTEPHRRYHCETHLEACLKLFAEVAEVAKEPAEVELALWFHDAVYDSQAQDNEEKSAAWAVAALTSSGVSAERAGRVAELVKATQHHEAKDPDAALLIGIDLSILGAAPAVYDQFEREVREEYRWVSDELWKQGRAKVLAKFLARPKLFTCEVLAVGLEKPARENLQRALDALQRPNSVASP